jgi:hypothetical protein
VAKRLVVVAEVPWMMEEKKVLEVAFEVVAFLAVKSWKVEDAVVKRLPKKPVPETEMAVEEA